VRIRLTRPGSNATFPRTLLHFFIGRGPAKATSVLRDVWFRLSRLSRNKGPAVVNRGEMPHIATVNKLVEPVSGDVAPARDELIVHVYTELRRLATGYLRRERTDHTLQPTALVHEAYMRLAAQEGVGWRNREHFLGVAAAMMRRVLVDHARGHKRDKRGGGLKLALAETDGYVEGTPDDLLALDVALRRLERKHLQKSRVVELRFFGGLSIEETARILGVSESTVERDWKFARAWLAREIDPGGRYA
jgi:RNA polymerase sigma-70 factor (ECF subfamily)